MQVLCSSPGWTRTNNPPVNSRMLCQLSYRGRQPRDCSRGLETSLGKDGDRGPRTSYHASLRRRRRRRVHWRLAVVPSGARCQCTRRCASDRSAGPRVQPWAGRRCPWAVDEECPDRVPAERGESAQLLEWAVPHVERSVREVARFSGSVSCASVRWVGTLRCSSSGSAGTGLARAQSTAGSQAAPRSRCVGTRGSEVSTRTASRAHTPTARLRAIRRLLGMSSRPVRASSR